MTIVRIVAQHAALYMSARWRAEYGRTLTREEVRLVQAFRGLDATEQDGILGLTSAMVLLRAQHGGGTAPSNIGKPVIDIDPDDDRDGA